MAFEHRYDCIASSSRSRKGAAQQAGCPSHRLLVIDLLFGSVEEMTLR